MPLRMPIPFPVLRAKRNQKRVVKLADAKGKATAKAREVEKLITRDNPRDHERLQSMVKIEKSHADKYQAAINHALRNISNLGYALEQRSYGLRATAKGLKEREMIAKKSGKKLSAKILHLRRRAAILAAKRAHKKSMRITEIYLPHTNKRTTRSSSK